MTAVLMYLALLLSLFAAAAGKKHLLIATLVTGPAFLALFFLVRLGYQTGSGFISTLFLSAAYVAACLVAAAIDFCIHLLLRGRRENETLLQFAAIADLAAFTIMLAERVKTGRSSSLRVRCPKSSR
jgi:hypothetical protein